MKGRDIDAFYMLAVLLFSIHSTRTAVCGSLQPPEQPLSELLQLQSTTSKGTAATHLSQQYRAVASDPDQNTWSFRRKLSKASTTDHEDKTAKDSAVSPAAAIDDSSSPRPVSQDLSVPPKLLLKDLSLGFSSTAALSTASGRRRLLSGIARGHYHGPNSSHGLSSQSILDSHLSVQGITESQHVDSISSNRRLLAQNDSTTTPALRIQDLYFSCSVLGGRGCRRLLQDSTKTGTQVMQNAQPNQDLSPHELRQQLQLQRQLQRQQAKQDRQQKQQQRQDFRQIWLPTNFTSSRPSPVESNQSSSQLQHQSETLPLSEQQPVSAESDSPLNLNSLIEEQAGPDTTYQPQELTDNLILSVFLASSSSPGTETDRSPSNHPKSKPPAKAPHASTDPQYIAKLHTVPPPAPPPPSPISFKSLRSLLAPAQLKLSDILGPLGIDLGALNNLPLPTAVNQQQQQQQKQQQQQLQLQHSLDDKQHALQDQQAQEQHARDDVAFLELLNMRAQALISAPDIKLSSFVPNAPQQRGSSGMGGAGATPVITVTDGNGVKINDLFPGK